MTDRAITLSPSQINRFLEEPALWFLERFFDVKTDAGPAAWRGDAVERGVDVALIDHATDQEALQAAMAAFDTRYQKALELRMKARQGEVDEEFEKDCDDERAMTAVLLVRALPLMRGYGKPIMRQHRIRTMLPCGLEATGYADWTWNGVGRDLKTVRQMPGIAKDAAGVEYVVPKPAHVRQMAIYSKALGTPFELIYVAPSKSRPAPMVARPTSGELEQAWAEVVAASHAMERIHHMVEEDGTAKDLALMYPPRDLTSYLWKDKAAREAATKVWGV